MNTIQVTSIYAALLGLMFVAITLRIVSQRYKLKISLGEGDNKDFQKLIRGHGNFVETVPIALLLLLLLELKGASVIVLHILGIALLAGRIMHYLKITGLVKPHIFRVLGMVLTLGTIAYACVSLLLRT